MGEFQCYQFRTIDRDLRDDELKEVNSWSSRGKVGRNSATFVYHYGDFKKDTAWAVEHYFDVLVYFNNFGQRQIIFKIPLGAIDDDAVSAYNIEADLDYESNIMLEIKPNCYLLHLNYSEEDGDWMEEDAFDVSALCNIRDAIIDGDYRALFLFWSHLVSCEAGFDDFDDEDEDDDTFEREQPPVPPNLKKLDKSLKEFVDFFLIAEETVEAAQKQSATAEAAEIDYHQKLAQLPCEEQSEWLRRLLDGEKALQKALQKRLKSL